MEIDSIIGMGAAPFIIPALVGATKPFVRLVFPKVCDDNVANSPWQFLAAVYGALWMVGLVQANHAPTEIDSMWTAVLVGIALGLGSTLVHKGAVAVDEKVSKAEPEPEPSITSEGPRWALGGEPQVAPYEPVRRSS